MTREELLKFVQDFNQSGPISMASIAECLKALPKKDHRLFLLLVNYKNGNDFSKKIKNGDL